jgi:serine/threonine-protein kinase
VITTGENVSFGPATPEKAAEILSPRLAPGSAIGPYELLELIGGGGMGRVFRAYDVRLSRVVALKVLTPEQASDPQILARFQNEARSAARLSHPGIVQVFSAGEHNGIYYIAFEFVEGINLRTHVEQDGPLSVAEALHYVLQVAESLEHANARGVIHRDIKPSNIIVTPNGRTKLIDLGLARMLHQNGRSLDLTTSGMTLGTFDYIAPEQARDPRLADIRSDIYSLGCTFFFLLSGQPPFPGGSVLQKLLQHQSEEPPNIRGIRPDVPEAVARIMRRMMAKSPRHRYQTPEELIQAIRSVTGIPGPAVSLSRDQGTSAATRKRMPLQQHLPWLVPVAILLLSTLVLDWWWSEGAEDAIYFGDDIRHQEGLFSPLTPTPPAPPSESEPTGQQGPGPEWPGSAHDTPFPGSSGVTEETNQVSGQAELGWAAENPVAGMNTTVPTGSKDSVASLTGSVLPGPSSPEYQGTIPPASPVSSEMSKERVSPQNKGDTVVEFPSRANPTISSPVSDLATSRSPVISRPERVSSGLSMASDWVRVVDPSSKEPGSYPTLEAACQAALPGDEIRLTFDGPLLVEGCDLRARQLTIKAAKGHFPELVFRASDRTKLRGNSFWTLAASNIVFEDVAMRIEIPPESSADDWCLFRITYNSVLELNRCVLSLIAMSDNRQAEAGNINVGSFFAFYEDPRSELLVRNEASKDENQSSANTVRIQRCIVRGEGDVFRSASRHSAQIMISESFLSVAGRLLDMQGTERIPASDANVVFQLRRLTVWTENGLIRQSQLTYQPHLQPVRVESDNCIFVADPKSSFIEQHVSGVDIALRLLTWFGRRNFYEKFGRFWSVVTGAPHSTPLQLSFEHWKAYWQSEHEQDAVWGGVPWRGPLPLEVPPHAHRPADFSVMDPSLDDIASDIANRAGCPASELPFLPPLDGYSTGIPSGGSGR